MNKCEKCAHESLYTLEPDECGSGNIDGRCLKGHWAGLGPIDENDKGDYWNNCKDFKSLNTKEE